MITVLSKTDTVIIKPELIVRLIFPGTTEIIEFKMKEGNYTMSSSHEATPIKRKEWDLS